MMWARNKYREGIRKKASPQEIGVCPICGEEVIAKCGSIKIWHWAHKNKKECDPWYENETEWHFKWKQMFPNENQEVRVENHRADIRSDKGFIIELQNSPLSSEKIKERESFYDSLIWVLNGKTIAKNIKYFKRRYIWNWFPSSWKNTKKPIYIDEGTNFLYLIDLDNEQFIKVSKEAFIIHHGGKPWKS